MAALAHGRAIVTTNPETTAPELRGAIETVPTNDPVALAQAIACLLDDSTRRSQLERAALDAARHFTWEGIARRTLAVFQELLA
jgi:glycosyltransferase involved in cell wall biosynthesis